VDYLNRPEEGIDYMKRVGAYGLLEDEDGRLAVIKTSTGYFLPGGGLEEGEELQACLVREFVEEAAIKVRIEDKLSVLSYFFYSTTMHIHMESVGHFYRCKFEEALDTGCEEDHQLVWLELKEASKKLFLENQKEAVKQFIHRTRT
jgi:8-oxo-dGTP diphosphatase